MIITYIHVNQGKLRGNLKNGTDDPIFTIKRGRKNARPQVARSVRIMGPSELLYDPAGILPCGAKAVIVTRAQVEASL